MSSVPGFHLAATERGRLLQLCAAAWAVAEWFPNEQCQQVVSLAEQVAEGRATREDLREAVASYRRQVWHDALRWPDRYKAAHLLTEWFGLDSPDNSLLGELEYARRLHLATRLLLDTDPPLGGWLSTFSSRTSDVLARTVVSIDPSWRTEAVVALARGMYEARDFAAMPVLADALEDAGCGQPDILAHCRGPGPHVRGCWVVDLVLGKA